ncbi:MAG TPA: DoxX family protein [Saprospiraceae bacterium]|nr:DoxX family protein [Saprospiraceae bacterium]
MKKSKRLHIALWVAQSLLAAAFLMAGMMKITVPIDELATNGMSFVYSFPESMVRFIGICEVLGSIGLILPALLRIKPILTPIASVGLAAIMVFAAIYHITHNEPPIPNIILLGLASFIAWGRFSKEPILPKIKE